MTFKHAPPDDVEGRHKSRPSITNDISNHHEADTGDAINTRRHGSSGTPGGNGQAPFSKLLWMDAVRRSRGIPSAQRLVICHIGATADKHGHNAWRANGDVMAEVGVSLDTVTRARKAAVRCGLMVETKPAPRGAGNTKTAEYRLVMPLANTGSGAGIYGEEPLGNTGSRVLHVHQMNQPAGYFRTSPPRRLKVAASPMHNRAIEPRASRNQYLMVVIPIWLGFAALPLASGSTSSGEGVMAEVGGVELAEFVEALRDQIRIAQAGADPALPIEVGPTTWSSQ